VWRYHGKGMALSNGNIWYFDKQHISHSVKQHWYFMITPDTSNEMSNIGIRSLREEFHCKPITLWLLNIFYTTPRILLSLQLEMTSLKSFILGYFSSISISHIKTKTKSITSAQKKQHNIITTLKLISGTCTPNNNH